jgi:hypothetical protein
MKIIYSILSFGLIFICSNKEIIIEKNYIENSNWNEHTNNSIKIERMKIIDPSLNIFSSSFKKEPNHWNIVNKLKVDSTFICSYFGLNYANNKPKLKGKVFFNKSNGWDWNINGKKKSTIGELKNENWYKFSELHTSAIYNYVYVDSIGGTHVFTANLSNY